MGTREIFIFGISMSTAIAYLRERKDGRLDVIWYGEPIATIDDDSNTNHRAIESINLYLEDCSNEHKQEERSRERSKLLGGSRGGD